MSGALASTTRGGRRGRVLALVLVLVTGAARAQAPSADPAARFEQANAAFGAGRYDDAIAGYQALLADGRSTALLYNLGNAWFRAGRLGEAILAYEQARLLGPRDADVDANLRQARNAAEVPQPEPRAWQRFVGLLGVDGWTLVASVALWLACALVSARRLAGPRLGGRGPVSLALAVLALGGALGVAGAATRLGERDRAVVIGVEPALRTAPYPSAAATAITPGEVVTIEREHGGFALVRTAAGKTGWMPDAEVGRIAGN
jgi:tetratricopeptide (TPR) repeat protein